ncbi:MAG: hypothetical protein ACO3QM_06765, partial [Candidatus Nanopelagicaceae bacterium]
FQPYLQVSINRQQLNGIKSILLTSGTAEAKQPQRPPSGPRIRLIVAPGATITMSKWARLDPQRNNQSPALLFRQH